MRFSCERDLLAESIATAGRALESKSFGSGVHLDLTGDSLVVSGHETDILIEVRVEVFGIEDGHCVVPSPLTSDLIRSLGEGVVEIEGDDINLAMRSQRAQMSVNLINDYNPPYTAQSESEPVTVKPSDLRDALSQVIRASAKSDARDFVYTGVLFAATDSGLRLVATDGVRMAIRDIAGLNFLGGDSEVIVPARSLSELERMLGSKSAQDELKVTISSKEASFEVGDTLLVTRLIEEKYRDYRQILQPSYPNRMVAPKREMMEALRRLRRMARENRDLTNLKMEITETSMVMSVHIPQVGTAREELDVTYVGEDIGLAFDPELLNEGVDAVTSDYVAMEMTASNKAVKISNADNSDLTYLLMPIRQ